MDKQLEELAIEIAELYEQLEQAEKENKIAQKKYLLEKTKAILKKIGAFAAVPVIGTTITTLAGWNPFKINNEKQHAYIVKTIDKDGTLTEEKTYRSDFDLENTEQSKLYYYTSWKKTNNNNYEREKYTYDLSEDDAEKVFSLTIKNNEITKNRIKELFPYYPIEEKEIRAELTQEEIKYPSYVEAIMVETNEDDIIITKESSTSHTTKLILMIILEGLAFVIEMMFLDESTTFFNKIEEVLSKEKPKSKDIEKIKKKIKVKQLIFETYPYNLPDEENNKDY